MNKKYSQEELDQILLSKKLNEFYLAIIEKRQELLTDEEYEAISRNSTIDGDNKDEVEDLIKTIKTDEHLKDFSDVFIRIMYSLAQVRYLTILTMIDDDVYDIGSTRFEDFKRNKIIHFDNLTTLYDESNARVRYATPEEDPSLKKRTVLVDLDDESIFYAYKNKYIHQEESEDLTKDFLTEVMGIPRTKNRQQG